MSRYIVMCKLPNGRWVAAHDSEAEYECEIVAKHEEERTGFPHRVYKMI